MPALTEALNRIMHWLKQHGPLDVSLLKPGLSQAEIEEIVAYLPWQLPNDIRELYQWKNGTREFSDYEDSPGVFAGWSFYPLQTVVASFQNRIKNYKSEHLTDTEDSYYALRIFFNIESTDEGYILIDNDTQKSSFVIFKYCKSGGCNPIIKYASLTDMMLTIAESYENCYSPEFNEDLAIDSNQFRQIWRKYNSYQIAEAALARIKGKLSLSLLLEVEEDLIQAKHSIVVEPLLQALHKSITNDEDLCLQHLAIKVLGELGDPKAIDSLIKCLHEEHALTRYYAAQSLGQLKDHRAIAPLVEVLQDSSTEVRQMAVWALLQLKAVDSLIQALQHSDVRVKRRAARGLGEIKDAKAVQPLSQLTKDVDSSVRATAQIALEQIRII